MPFVIGDISFTPEGDRLRVTIAEQPPTTTWTVRDASVAATYLLAWVRRRGWITAPHHPRGEPCACQPGTAGWAKHHGSAPGTLPEAFDGAMESYAEPEE